MVYPSKSDRTLTTSAHAVDLPNFHVSLYESFGKRLFDVMFFLLIAPAVIPVILILAVLVKMDGGSAFYAQRRIGRDGRMFQFYKLRSMRVNADQLLVQLCKENPEIAKEWSTYQKLRHDPRITKIGRFIRKTSLDELPQVLNVLKGDMSFVGPRPFMPSQQMLYEKAKGRAYFEMRPGLTGMWQVSARGETSFVARVKFDDLYHRKQSFMTDVSLILRTVTVVFKTTGH